MKSARTNFVNLEGASFLSCLIGILRVVFGCERFQTAIMVDLKFGSVQVSVYLLKDLGISLDVHISITSQIFVWIPAADFLADSMGLKKGFVSGHVISVFAYLLSIIFYKI